MGQRQDLHGRADLHPLRAGGDGRGDGEGRRGPSGPARSAARPATSRRGPTVRRHRSARIPRRSCPPRSAPSDGGTRERRRTPSGSRSPWRRGHAPPSAYRTPSAAHAPDCRPTAIRSEGSVRAHGEQVALVAGDPETAVFALIGRTVRPITASAMRSRRWVSRPLMRITSSGLRSCLIASTADRTLRPPERCWSLASQPASLRPSTVGFSSRRWRARRSPRCARRGADRSAPCRRSARRRPPAQRSDYRDFREGVERGIDGLDAALVLVSNEVGAVL